MKLQLFFLLDILYRSFNSSLHANLYIYRFHLPTCMWNMLSAFIIRGIAFFLFFFVIIPTHVLICLAYAWSISLSFYCQCGFHGEDHLTNDRDLSGGLFNVLSDIEFQELAGVRRLSSRLESSEKYIPASSDEHLSGGSAATAAHSSYISSSSMPSSSVTAHYAHGQHLLLDLYQLDPALLNDKDALLVSMTRVVHALGMTVMGAVAERLQPQGVTIAIALKESHFAVHTYPEFRTAFVDLFTCGETQLLQHLDVLAAAFGANVRESEHTKWAFQKRGIHLHQVTDADFELSFLQSEKRLVHTAHTGFQKIDIWDFRNDDYWGAQSTPQDLVARAIDLGAAIDLGQKLPAAVSGGKKGRGGRVVRGGNANATQALWSRTLFMDGSLQSNSADEYKYHESLVHPAMLSHVTGARRVAVVGGGEGATVREVLKYRSVQHVEMIEIDRGIVDVARLHLQQYHNCSFLQSKRSTAGVIVGDGKKSGREQQQQKEEEDEEGKAFLSSLPFFSCFDDPRVHVRNEDAVQFFADRSVRPTNPWAGAVKVAAPGSGRVGLQCPRRRKYFRAGKGVRRGRGVLKQKALKGRRRSRFSGSGKGGAGQSPADVRRQQGQRLLRQITSSDTSAVGAAASGKAGRFQTPDGYTTADTGAGTGAGGGMDGDADVEGYDVIILDLFDPEDFRRDLVDKLYSQETLQNLACLLRQDGVLVAQIGESPTAMTEEFLHEDTARHLHTLKLDILERLAELLDEKQVRWCCGERGERGTILQQYGMIKTDRAIIEVFIE